jgi:hypothetical protein
VPAIEPSTSVRRPGRRRLLVHAGVFAAAGLACVALSSSATSAAPTTQPGRFLEGGSATLAYSCTGADQTTNDLLTTFGLNPFSMPITITSAAVEPSPSPGEDFTGEFTWDFTLDQSVVLFAVGLGVTDFTITNGVNPVTATDGATGSAPGTGAPAAVVVLGDGTVPVGYTAGPYSGTFNRTAAVDAPITFTPGTITSSVTTNGGTSLQIQCTSPGGGITVVDQTGVAPSTTTTTRPSVVTTTTVAGGPTTTAAVGGTEELPRTGSSSNLFLVLLALGLIDVGYLALSASRSNRGRARSVS